MGSSVLLIAFLLASFFENSRWGVVLCRTPLPAGPCMHLRYNFNIYSRKTQNKHILFFSVLIGFQLFAAVFFYYTSIVEEVSDDCLREKGTCQVQFEKKTSVPVT
jgi:hypothetical protein